MRDGNNSTFNVQRSTFNVQKWLGRLSLFATALLIAGCAADPGPKMLAEGWQQLQANQPDQALATAQNIAGEMPKSRHAAEALYLKGRAYEAKVARSAADQRTHLTAAAGAYSEALKKKPSRQLQGRIYAGLGNVNYWLEDFSSAWRNWATAYDLTEEAPAKSYILYRIGLCQQRLGRFSEADLTFAAVVKQFGTSDPALRAKSKIGARNFSVQVATFASAQSAQRAIGSLQSQGFMPVGAVNPAGQTVISIAPFANYQQAKVVRERVAATFPDALILP